MDAERADALIARLLETLQEFTDVMPFMIDVWSDARGLPAVLVHGDNEPIPYLPAPWPSYVDPDAAGWVQRATAAGWAVPPPSEEGSKP